MHHIDFNFKLTIIKYLNSLTVETLHFILYFKLFHGSNSQPGILNYLAVILATYPPYLLRQL